LPFVRHIYAKYFAFLAYAADICITLGGVVASQSSQAAASSQAAGSYYYKLSIS
jgi:hypothetical protein